MRTHIGVTGMRQVAALAAAVAWVGTAAAQSAAPSAPLHVLSSNGVRAALEVVLPQCERQLGRSVDIEYGTSASIRQRVNGGEAVDVAFITTPVVAELGRAGHLDPRSIVNLGRAGIGVGVKAGGRRFAIGTADEIKRAMLDARSVTFAREGASRTHLESMFEKLGIAAEMQAKTLLEPGSVQAAAKVAAGEAEVLLTLVSEILPEDGMELVGPLPAEFQNYISFDAALGAQTERTGTGAAGRALVACVTAPAATPAFAEHGVQR